MSYQSVRMRQVVDWRAAFRASIIAGIFFLLLNLILTNLTFGTNGWVFIRLLASLILNKEILAPPATFDGVALVVALGTHFALSIGFGLLIAYIIHRGGLITGIVGGAILGLALYAINFYSLTLFFPWFFAMRSWVMVLTHMIFGALAGGIYEALEVEIFVPEENNL
jgi:hypothetical protein